MKRNLDCDSKAVVQNINTLYCKKNNDDPNTLSQTQLGEKMRTMSDQLEEVHTELYDQGEIDDPVKDGYRWRKYGQKSLKEGDFSRSYFKCSTAACSARKFIDQSLDGVVLKIAYRNSHNHSQPDNIHHHTMEEVLSEYKVTGEEGELKANENVGTSAQPNQNNHLGLMESMPTQDGDDTFTEGCLSSDDYVKKVSEPNRSSLGAPKVILKMESEEDVVDDGYKWRKYGQKVVKGNENPRNYYKCTKVGCRTKKHIQRDLDDPKFVITVYEGKHNHEVPVARNTSHNNASDCNSIPISQDPIDRESSQGRVKIPKIDPLIFDSFPDFYFESGIGFPYANFGMSLHGGCSSNVRPLLEEHSLVHIPPPPMDFFSLGPNTRRIEDPQPDGFSALCLDTTPIPLPEYAIPPSMDSLAATFINAMINSSSSSKPFPNYIGVG